MCGRAYLVLHWLLATTQTGCQKVCLHGKHLQDVAAERALDIFQVNLSKILAHHLLRRVVDQDINLAVSVRTSVFLLDDD